MNTLKLLVIPVCIFFNISLQAQTIDFGISNKGSEFAELVADEGGNFYTTSLIKTALYMSLVDYKLCRFENMTKVAEGKIQRDLHKGKGEFIGSTCLDGKLIVFLSNTEKTTTSMYYQVYDKQCKPVSEPTLIAEKSKNGGFRYMISENKQFLLFEYLKKGKEADENRLVYKVLNSDFAVVQEGEYEPGENISGSALTNNGDYLIASSVSKSGTGKIESYKIKHFKDGIATDLKVDVENKMQYSFNMSVTDDNQLILLGAFSEAQKKGFAYININLETGKETKRAYCIPNTGLKIEYLRDYFLDQDGGLVVLVEEYFEKSVTTNYSNGGMTTKTTYNYNAASAFKIKDHGDAEWVVKIPKHQNSINDRGMASSLVGYKNGGKYYLFFNDNLKNYGVDGSFLEPETVETCFYKSKKCGFIKVEIDLKSGENQRQIMLKPGVQPLFAIPDYFVKTEDRNEMLVYFTNKKTEQFGLMKF